MPDFHDEDEFGEFKMGDVVRTIRELGAIASLCDRISFPLGTKLVLGPKHLSWDRAFYLKEHPNTVVFTWEIERVPPPFNDDEIYDLNQGLWLKAIRDFSARTQVPLTVAKRAAEEYGDANNLREHKECSRCSGTGKAKEWKRRP